MNDLIIAGMKWIKIKDEKPPRECNIFHLDNKLIPSLLYVSSTGEVYSRSYSCNQKECHWTYDDCGCEFILEDNDWWMLVPEI